MTLFNCKLKFLFQILISLILLLIFNEYIVYFLVLLKCQWPTLTTSIKSSSSVSSVYSGEFLKVMILADVHLLGSREGHWFDKLRREWQMERSFQTSMLVHDPDVVFILGDLFDEGKWCSDAEFQYYVNRFRSKFSTPERTRLYVVAGNHDMGFHYAIDDHKRMRFSKHLSSPLVQLLIINGNAFVLLNSMAFEGDRCSMCTKAENELNDIIKKFKCAQINGDDCMGNQVTYNPPIIMQHFPLYRESDANCSGPDSSPEDEKFMMMKPKWDCLDRNISNKILTSLKPRLVFSGHTHHFCLTHHNRNQTPEWTVPSFSWRYKNLPSFLMMSLTPTAYDISKCYLPTESAVVSTYKYGVAVIFVFFLLYKKFNWCHRKSANKFG
ncbi:hypothetical protein HELRODRAFT_189769 [Helobdella robusta]|uniref:Calcineurin-like phosphoesterase domain-containing protein n=1 Tax=Helobdella robusta TaxID=6412 RepID=T1FRC9_HELRO|nr:hypothetical protein HELRODRAFT_189769 [Helobdella robusta]ESN91680.1 hypothetical protein HELRODRAFT_189769 [Helobdella robusta]